MRINDFIESTFGLVDLPLELTENNDSKMVKGFGLLAYVIFFIPAILLALLVAGVLAIPAMIQGD